MRRSVKTGVESVDDNEIANEPTRHAIKQMHSPIGVPKHDSDNATKQKEAKTQAIRYEPYMPLPKPLNQLMDEIAFHKNYSQQGR